MWLGQKKRDINELLVEQWRKEEKSRHEMQWRTGVQYEVTWHRSPSRVLLCVGVSDARAYVERSCTWLNFKCCALLLAGVSDASRTTSQLPTCTDGRDSLTTRSPTYKLLSQSNFVHNISIGTQSTSPNAIYYKFILSNNVRKALKAWTSWQSCQALI